MPITTRRTLLRHTALGAACGLLALPAGLWPVRPLQAASPVVPGLLYAVGQKFDRSFNEGALAGAERFAQATGAKTVEFLPQSPAEFERGIQGLARHKVTDVAVIGFYYATPLAQVAPRYPAVRFTLVDAVVEAPNVRSVVFKEHEGAFLTGVLAALASKTGTIGFIGALDIPLIRRFIAGYTQGARHARPDARVLVNFVGTTPAAFNDPATGTEVAVSQIQRGADVLFAGAGTSNFGVFATAKDKGVLAIGVDSNQNGLYPGTILTSMLKRVDRAVEGTFQAAASGTWAPGTVALGLAGDGVGLAIDDNNRPLLTPAMLERVDAARAAIIQGRITVADTLPPADAAGTPP
ncbi:basic membrane protein A [Azospirillum fermentarium]|uniref:BMP family lipoprotein n=1 Tax=Azospirillum fermentarium TaxID=1233114 RepID=UPI0022270AD4|nr:BMP family ABC transporter substrate-binding protein [Azospirillum fermentarium]MCW2245857.1 basic membrane protein A [Azospirillum fermentarium]